MTIEQIQTVADIETYIEGCLNDLETGLSTKNETVVSLANLVVYVYNIGTKQL